MKFLIFIFVYFVAYNGMVSAACAPELKERLGQCYNSSIFALNPLTFRDNFPTIFLNNSDLTEVCKDKASLDKCITAEIKESCFNVQDFAGLSFSKQHNTTIQDGINALVNYLQHDYVCGAAFSALTDSYNCIGIQGANDKCPLNFENYDTARGHATCATNLIEKRCGPAAGCFAQKFLSVHSCYATDTERDECKAISYKYNPMIGCDADVKGGNGSESSYVLSFILMIVTLLIL